MCIQIAQSQKLLQFLCNADRSSRRAPCAQTAHSVCIPAPQKATVATRPRSRALPFNHGKLRVGRLLWLSMHGHATVCAAILAKRPQGTRNFRARQLSRMLTSPVACVGSGRARTASVRLCWQICQDSVLRSSFRLRFHVGCRCSQRSGTRY